MGPEARRREGVESGGEAAGTAASCDVSAPGRRVPLRVVAFALLLLGLAVGFVVAWIQGWVSPASIQRAARDAGRGAMAVYVAAVIVGELCWMPRMWGLFAGGLLFGPVAGGLLSLGADMISALAGWLLARSTAREWVAGLLARRPKAERVVELLARRRGAVTIAVLRVCPIAHYTLVSLAAGLTGVPLRSFALGTAVGIVPGAILYPLVGDSLSRPTSPVFLASVAILVIALAVTLRLGRRVLREGPAADAAAGGDGR